jgi:hypothetical protein
MFLTVNVSEIDFFVDDVLGVRRSITYQICFLKIGLGIESLSK